MGDRRLWLVSKLNAYLEELGDTPELIAQRLLRDEVRGEYDNEYSTVVGNWIADKFFIDTMSVRIHEDSLKIAEDGLSVSSKLPLPVIEFLERWGNGEWLDLIDDDLDELYEEEYNDR